MEAQIKGCRSRPSGQTMAFIVASVLKPSENRVISLSRSILCVLNRELLNTQVVGFEHTNGYSLAYGVVLAP